MKVNLTADYHTHTKYSHGKGSVLENAMQAKELGLKQLGISDHGFAQLAFGLRHKKLPQLIADCRQASKETGVEVLVGIESNLCGEQGTTDLKEKDYPYFDIYLMGIHMFVNFDKFRDMRKIMFSSYFQTVFKREGSQKLKTYTTNALINSIKKYPIDVITHLNFISFCDVVEVAKAARDYGTYIELNAKKVHMTDEELFKVCETGVRFVIDSDAHSPARVGEIALVENMLDRVNIPLDRIDNIDGRLPNFRFKAFKEKM